MSASARPLFRREASVPDSWPGRCTAVAGLPATFTAVAAALLGIAVVALITFGEYTRRVDLGGVMLPTSGLIAVSAPVTGWIRHLNVTEGEAVAENTLLYTIDLDTSIKGGGLQQAIIDTLTARRNELNGAIERKQAMANATADELAGRIDNLREQIAQSDVQIQMQTSFASSLRDQYTQYLRLFQQHNLPGSELDARQQAWMSGQSTLEQLKGTGLRLRSDLIEAQYQAETNPISVKNDIDDLKGKIEEIDQSIANSESHRVIEVRAPGRGIVTAIVAQPGQVMTAGTRLLTIVPKGDAMVGQLLAPSTAVGFIHPGDRVLLRYSGFPYQKFGQYGGAVESISRAALHEDEVRQWQVGDWANTHPGPYYRVTVRPDRQTIETFGDAQTIPANMQVNAYVLLDKRPLYQWILEPLYSVRNAWRAH
jgi:membrane fusion protein